MNILYLAPEIALPGSHGGSSHVTGKLASLRRLGHHIILISQWSPEQRFVEKTKDLLSLRIPILPGSVLRNLSYLFFTFFLGLFVLIRYDVDLVYERGRLFGGVGVMIASLFGVKSIYEINEPYCDVPVLLGQFSETSLLIRLARWWHGIVVDKTSMVTVTHESLIEHGSAPKGKSIVIVHGVDIGVFQQHHAATIRKKYHLDRKFVVLYTGSFAAWHSCEQLVKAAQKISQKNNNTVFLMVGEGEYLEGCKELTRKLNIEKHVLFPGKVPFEQIPSYEHAADVCVALFDRKYPPFQKFSFYYSPMKITEYMACGKPIVASNFGNLKKLVVDGKNGLLVREDKIDDITQAILKLSRQKTLCKKIGNYNRQQTARFYDWDVINSCILERLGKRAH